MEIPPALNTILTNLIKQGLVDVQVLRLFARITLLHASNKFIPVLFFSARLEREKYSVKTGEKNHGGSRAISVLRGGSLNSRRSVSEFVIPAG